MIQLDGVRKEFGTKVAVESLTLEVPSGEFFAFLGPNGAGKTTTIKMIAGLLRPSAGRVRVCGIDLSKEYLAAKSLLAYVPDQPYLYDKLSGREFMRFMGEMYRLPRMEIERETARLSEIFGMSEFLDELAETYSHGMKQRLVLAATLLHHPKVMVVDEPLVGLDPPSARLVKDILLQQARAGTTIFLTTHILSLAEETADRVGILMRGRLEALGTVSELRARARVDGDLEDVFLRILEEGRGGGTPIPEAGFALPPVASAPPQASSDPVAPAGGGADLPGGGRT